MKEVICQNKKKKEKKKSGCTVWGKCLEFSKSVLNKKKKGFVIQKKKQTVKSRVRIVVQGSR